MGPDVQFALRPGIMELRWGDPAPSLLPVAGVRRAVERALELAGPSALNYGAEQGPARLIEPLRTWLERRRGSAPPADQIFITGGTSQALDLLCTLLARPGDVVLVESPTYHLALRIFRDHGLEVISVPGDEQGLQVDRLEAALETLRRPARSRPAVTGSSLRRGEIGKGQALRFLYIVPTFGNPTGANLSPQRRQALVSVASREGFLLLEDDVYRDLWYDSPPPPALSDLAPPGTVVRLSTFSKILAPGLRLGWLEAVPEITRRCAGSGLLDSGGGTSHFVAHVVGAMIEMGLLDEHIALLRASYRQRRDALLDALGRYMPATCSWMRPGGGFFVWLRMPEGCDSAALLPVAEAAGVSYAPGGRFCIGGGGERYARLGFSLLEPDELVEGARRLGRVLERCGS